VLYPEYHEQLIAGRTLRPTYLSRDEDGEVRWHPNFLEALSIGNIYDHGMEDGSPSDEPVRWDDVRGRWVEKNPRTDAQIIGACPECQNADTSFGPDRPSGHPSAKCNGCGETWTLGLDSGTGDRREDFHADG